MMQDAMYYQEEENKRKGLIVSMFIHLLIFLLCLIPYMQTEETETVSGILVALGDPDEGSKNDAPSQALSPSNEPEEQITKSTKPEVQPPSRNEAVKTPVVAKPVDQESSIQASEKNPLPEKTPAEILEEQRKAAEQAAKEKAEAEAAARAAKLDEKKSQFGSLFGSGSGSGNQNNEGNQGDPSGSPDSSNLNDLAKGSGKIGGGLSNRGVLYEPDIRDNTQKTGRVVIKVCVNQSGTVVEANFTQRGSTTTDAHLVKIAEQGAMKYTFTKSDIELQCGTITVDFKVK